MKLWVTLRQTEVNSSVGDMIVICSFVVGYLSTNHLICNIDFMDAGAYHTLAPRGRPRTEDDEPTGKEVIMLVLWFGIFDQSCPRGMAPSGRQVSMARRRSGKGKPGGKVFFSQLLSVNKISGGAPLPSGARSSVKPSQDSLFLFFSFLFF